MSSIKPYVTVLMPAYNAEKFIAEAIESILNQTFENFEFIIVDDGSEDSTRDIIELYKSKDKRIQLLRNEENKGISYSLNKGIEKAQGKYLARMDADDISLPIRLKTQVDFMDSHSEVAVSSAWIETFGSVEKSIWISPTTHDEIVAALFCNNCIWHPVSIIRKEVLDDFDLRYDLKFKNGQDYRLWTQISNFRKLANIPKVLLKYRIHDNQKTTSKIIPKNGSPFRHQLRIESPGVREGQLKNLFSRDITFDEVELHAKLFFDIPFVEEQELNNIQEWVDFLISVNHEKKKYIEPTFSNTLQQTVLNTKKKSFKFFCNQQKRFTPKILIKLFFSRNKYYSSFSLFQLMLITKNCLTFKRNKNYSDEYLQNKS